MDRTVSSCRHNVGPTGQFIPPAHVQDSLRDQRHAAAEQGGQL
jgi:hypothetical protein